MTKRKPNPQPCEKWIPANKLPANVDYGWSDRVLICQFKPGDLHPMLLIASYNFLPGEWRSAMGTIENVTHWQPLPDYPKEVKDEEQLSNERELKCERCGLYRQYQHPRTGKIYKLCVSCGLEALTELCNFAEDYKKEEIE